MQSGPPEILKRIKPFNLLSYGVAVGCLYWVFHDIRFGAVLQSIRAIHWWWLVPAVILDLLVYVCAGWEWHLLLKPLGDLSVWHTTKAVFAGRFANDVLPVHAGYIVRIYLAARWLGSSVASIIPSLLIERIFDGLWLAVGIGCLSLFLPLPSSLARAGDVLGAIILVGVLVTGWMILRKPKEPARVEWTSSSGWGALRKLKRFLIEVDNGIRSIGRSYLMLAALALSIVKLVLQALAFLCVVRAYDFPFSLWAGLGIFMITYIGIAVPSTPASLGVFQLFCTAGLRFFGVPKTAASGFALLAYVVLTAPLALAGFIAITQSGLSLRQVRREASEWNRQRRP